MRLAFIEELLFLAKHNKDICLLTGDLGFSVFEPFIEQFPDRYINMGVAEQNMVGVATGLALSGKKVFIYSISNFPTLRCLEQIRNDICYHNADVKIVSVGCGFSYGLHGYTHFGIEDISILRTLPNIKIISPADPVETRLAMSEIVNYNGPCYLRLGASKEKILHTNGSLAVSSLRMLPIISAGNSMSVLSVGTITTYVQEFIKKENINCNLWSVPVVKPLDMEQLKLIARTSSTIITVEEHQLTGGFGSAILEALIDLKKSQLITTLPDVYRIGIEQVPMVDIGDQDYLRNKIDFSLLKQLGTKQC